MPGELSGARILVPRGGAWGDDVARAIGERGGEAVIAPLISFAAPSDGRALEDARRALAAGDYDWLVVTSVRAVEAMLGGQTLAAHSAFELPSALCVAAVGPATTAALREIGVEPDFVPNHDTSADGVVAEWPGEADARILWPRSSEAAPTISDGLRARGMRVDAPIAYRTVTQPLTEAVRAELATHRILVALVTSGSIARALADELAPLGAKPPAIVTIGPKTSADARAVGLAVAGEAGERTVASLLDAAAEVLRRQASRA